MPHTKLDIPTADSKTQLRSAAKQLQKELDTHPLLLASLGGTLTTWLGDSKALPAPANPGKEPEFRRLCCAGPGSAEQGCG